MNQTLYDKLWTAHVVSEERDENGDTTALLYIDRQMLHEVSSPQGFEGLRARGLPVHRAETQLAVADHAVPTRHRDRPIADPLARAQVALLERNTTDTGLRYIPLSDRRHGIVHVIGPEQGFTLPGITLVCGDSHTSTHGAFGALAFGIGASEVECVLATQTLRQRRARNLRVRVQGLLPPGVKAKDVVLAAIGRLGASGAVGHTLEFCGDTIARMSMAERMTVCNMAIEAGARSGLVAPDDCTYAWLEGRPMAPRGNLWERALDHWRTLHSDADAVFDRTLDIDASTLAPQVTWGTSPDQVLPIDGRVPDPAAAASAPQARKIARALEYMGLAAGTALQDVPIDHVFIGSCTNSRIEDLRDAAAQLQGRSKAAHVKALVVPGSAQVARQAEAEGLDRLFTAAGFEWRAPACSLCVAMNDDRLLPGERCASTSNRNFEGRQGVGARTHLMSPAMAAASAIAGHLADPRLLPAC
ncbi:3-isopropylmalate dehydratase large subunit [Pseudorhodoferax sp. Leaf274]|uniref:3-isopropylmalate dehydratase large subunit n=1 Tax=Pseudorhodoferax sp. Leaf274 TaxID=1736318 RepID=UPI0007035516|nr:3-isopropylmalate dehydratase large subunit [Pseudorhodoferax sp. Leaf274]KQP46267.1 isopropylmalate isomerase [Pseudorhodoferax sp. Leaf274]